MSLTLLFEDSEVASVQRLGEDVIIKFAAAHMRRDADNSLSKNDVGYSRGVELQLHGVEGTAVCNALLGRISFGRVRKDGVWIAGIQVPSATAGAVVLELHFANREQIELSATAMQCRFSGEANFTESLMC